MDWIKVLLGTLIVGYSTGVYGNLQKVQKSQIEILCELKNKDYEVKL